MLKFFRTIVKPFSYVLIVDDVVQKTAKLADHMSKKINTVKA